MSKCTNCGKLTFPRKFPLLIHVQGWGPYVQGKTCKYCARCELIVCHQDELEEQLFEAFSRLDPRVIGNDYLVLGTVKTAAWQAGLSANPPGVDEALDKAAGFKRYYDLQYDPGGWRSPGAPPRLLEPRHPDTSWRRGAGALRQRNALDRVAPGPDWRAAAPGRNTK